MIKAITLDLDHTIIDYSNSFTKLAEKYFDSDLPIETWDKINFKLITEQRFGRDMWTQLQGELYSKYIEFANPYKGVIDFLEYLSQKKIDYYIVSHKTEFSFSNPEQNLYKSATNWINKHLISDKNQLYFSNKNIFFEDTISNKISRIKLLNPTYHIDDLPEIISLLPTTTQGILFDSNKVNKFDLQVENWIGILNRVSRYA